MFLPKFEISNKLLRNLIKIEVDINVLKNIEIPLEWQTRLKKEIQVKRAVSVLRADNVDVSSDIVLKVFTDEPGRDEKVSDLALRLGIVIKERDLQAIINWLNCQRLSDQIIYLSTKFKQGELGEKELIQINKLIGERLVKSEDLGEKRKETYVEGSLLDHPKIYEIAYQLEDVLNWGKIESVTQIHPVLKSIIIFYELIKIRPFLHNNLQTITFFYLIILGIHGYEINYCALEEEMYKNKQKVFEVMARVDSNTEGVTDFMEMMTEMMAIAFEKARIRVMSITGESVKYKTETGRAVALTERQVALMEELTVKNQLTIKELRAVLPLVSDDTILRDLKDLVAKKMIRKKGKTKGAVYVLGKVKSFR